MAHMSYTRVIQDITGAGLVSYWLRTSLEESNGYQELKSDKVKRPFGKVPTCLQGRWIDAQGGIPRSNNVCPTQSGSATCARVELIV